MRKINVGDELEVESDDHDEILSVVVMTEQPLCRHFVVEDTIGRPWSLFVQMDGKLWIYQIPDDQIDIFSGVPDGLL